MEMLSRDSVHCVIIYHYSKVLKILTCIHMTGEHNKQFLNTVNDLLFPNTVNQKGEKPHNAGLNGTAL